MQQFHDILGHKSVFPGDNVPASPGKITACADHWEMAQKLL